MCGGGGGAGGGPTKTYGDVARPSLQDTAQQVFPKGHRASSCGRSILEMNC